MSVDTSKERRMVANLRFRGRRILPVADGSIDQEDEYILAGLYFFAFPPSMDDVGRIRISVGGVMNFRTFNRLKISTGGTYKFGVKANA